MNKLSVSRKKEKKYKRERKKKHLIPKDQTLDFDMIFYGFVRLPQLSAVMCITEVITIRILLITAKVICK